MGYLSQPHLLQLDRLSYTLQDLFEKREVKVYPLKVDLYTNYVERIDPVDTQEPDHLEEELIMFNSSQFREVVVRPTLNRIGLWSQEAEDLLVGTAAVESRLGTFLKQIRGPALGVFQMEPATHDYLWEGYLGRPGKKHIAEKIKQLTAIAPLNPEGEGYQELAYNLPYATAMARIHYLRFPEKIPTREEFSTEGEYIEALGKYWKKYYNTYKGKGKVEDFVKAWEICECSM